MLAFKLSDGTPFRPEDYAVTVTPLSDDDGGGFLATIPDLPGCMGDGESELDAITDVRRAALQWADATLEDGLEIPFPSAGVPLAAE